MRILVLGGTASVGRAIVEDLLGSGAEVTLRPAEGGPRGQRRSPAKARAAGMPATPLDVTVADVLAWDRQRGEPPLDGGFTPEQEQAVLAAAGSAR